MALEQPAPAMPAEPLPGQMPRNEAPRGRSANPNRQFSCTWHVEVDLRSHMVVRKAKLVDDAAGDVLAERPEIIWPTWPATPKEAAAVARAPLDHLEEYWRITGNRLRESAKWMATVLGVALAAIVGTSPLAYLTRHHLELVAGGLCLGGLVLLGITMTLILRVMQPQAVTYAALESAQPPRPIRRWQQTIEEHPDLYLPCGVRSLKDLRLSMELEEATLVKLVQLEDTTPDHARIMHKAEIARSARLFELRTAAASIAMVAEYYALRARSTQAIYWGVATGTLGTAAIVLCFAWPLK
jgi:hypothetical protein